METLLKIIHIDMDCFYAAVEEYDQPQYRGQPLAVGGGADQRGVLCTCNYPARRFGLHAAMSTKKALSLCPDLVLLPVNMARYREVSASIHNILRQFSHQIEPLSLDEAYLDVTDCQLFQNSATHIAREIKKQIEKQLGLIASAGVAPNKFLAKIASDWKKPDGLFVITPDQVAEFIQGLPIEKLWGVGKVTTRKCHQLGIMTCWDLQQYSQIELHQRFGKFGHRLYELCRGIDPQPVQSNRIRRSLSVEKTFPVDLLDPSQAEVELEELYDILKYRLVKQSHRLIKGQFVKVKFNDFKQTTAECTLDQLDFDRFVRLLNQGYTRGSKPIRLIGLGVKFADLQDRQGHHLQQISML